MARIATMIGAAAALMAGAMDLSTLGSGARQGQQAKPT